MSDHVTIIAISSDQCWRVCIILLVLRNACWKRAGKRGLARLAPHVEQGRELAEGLWRGVQWMVGGDTSRGSFPHPQSYEWWNESWCQQVGRHADRATLLLCPANLRLWKIFSVTVPYDCTRERCFIFVWWGVADCGSSVGIATRKGLEGPGIESRWGRDFPHLSRPALGPTQSPVQWVPGLFRG